MKKSIALSLVLAFILAACNTVEGVGKDLERGGEIIKDSAK